MKKMMKKMNTSNEQTAKLIELGFVPKVEIKEVRVVHSKVKIDHDCNFNIGGLIEILNGVSELEITRFGSGWGVYDELRAFTSEELIDALYDMIIKLKEEEVI